MWASASGNPLPLSIRESCSGAFNLYLLISDAKVQKILMQNKQLFKKHHHFYTPVRQVG
jgi:hypothetical protein